MTEVFQQVLHSAMALPVDERSRLIDELLSSLPAEEAVAIEDEWREIVKLRLQEYDEGRVQGIPWEEVKARARERVLRHG